MFCFEMWFARTFISNFFFELRQQIERLDRMA